MKPPAEEGHPGANNSPKRGEDETGPDGDHSPKRGAEETDTDYERRLKRDAKDRGGRSTTAPKEILL